MGYQSICSRRLLQWIYVYNFNIYTGKGVEYDTPQFGLCTQAVIDLVQELSGKGHVVYTDNYYTSPELYMYLYEREIYACGTCKPGRKG